MELNNFLLNNIHKKKCFCGTFPTQSDNLEKMYEMNKKIIENTCIFSTIVRPRSLAPRLRQKFGESRHRLALGHQRIFNFAGVGLTERHAAHHRFIRRQLQHLADDLVILRECRLWAGIETASARRAHDVLQKHAVVEP